VRISQNFRRARSQPEWRPGRRRTGLTRVVLPGAGAAIAVMGGVATNRHPDSKDSAALLRELTGRSSDDGS
jgi:hypothetical protein